MQSIRTILMKLEFSRDIYFLNKQLSNLINIRSMGDELLRADGQMDRQRSSYSLFAVFRVRL
jgi:hypothetical protein